MKRSNDAGTSPVTECSAPDWNDDCRNADAGGIGLDANAQLYPAESRAHTFLIAEFQDALSDPHFAGGLHAGTCWRTGIWKFQLLQNIC